MTFLAWATRLMTRVCPQDIHLASVVEVLQSIKQSDMTPLLRHIYDSPSGSALLDVLMKYLYAPLSSPPIQPPPSAIPQSNPPWPPPRSYKGMSHAPSPTTTSNSNHNTPNPPRAPSLTPQSTGFSQVHARGGGEGGGQAMSVLLSWHEKVVEMAGAGAVVRTMTDRRTV